MRLWHKDLIPVLPRQQLLSQWRECCCIARNISVNGTPNHLLVNKVLDYEPAHLALYSYRVAEEMRRRGYSCDVSLYTKHLAIGSTVISDEDMFDGWHNDRYIRQCLLNLQEKFDCGGITAEEWQKMIPIYETAFPAGPNTGRKEK